MFTTVEGDWDEVMAVVKRAVDVVAEVSPRVGLVLKADIRPGFEGQLTAKVDRSTRCSGSHGGSSWAPTCVSVRTNPSDRRRR